MDKHNVDKDIQNVNKTQNQKLFSLKMKWDSDIWYNMDETLKYPKSDKKRQILYYYTYMRYLE